MTTAYLSYLQTILGIENVVIDFSTAATVSMASKASAAKPLFVLEKSPSLQSVSTPGPVSDLFDKMVAALGWQREEIEVRELDLDDESIASAMVLLTALAAEKKWSRFPQAVTKSYHPTELLAQPQLKRAAWDFLQSARRSQ